MPDRDELIETTPTTAGADRVARTTEVSQVSRSGAQVDRVDSVAYDPYAGRRMAVSRVTQLIYLIFGLIEALIVIRFILRALGANASAGFAEFIYNITAPLVAPFAGLFGNPQAQGSVIELHSIIAVIVYALLAWLLARLVGIVIGESRSAVKSSTTEIDSRP